MTAKLLRTLATAGVLMSVVNGPPVDAQGRSTSSRESMTGSDSFRFYCASCHGTTGQGDGPAAGALNAGPPDLTALARLNGGTFPRDRVRAVVTGTARPIAAHGSTDMPMWGPVFRAFGLSASGARLRIESLVRYVESLQIPAAAPGVSGARLFRTYCASCHSADGRGGGPLAERLRHAPPDLTRYTERNSGVFPSERVRRIVDGREVLSHGDRDMPVWGDAFRSEPDGLTADQVKARIEAIVEYLRAIQRRDAE
jgi:mono/diheme cytochrome c family protein